MQGHHQSISGGGQGREEENPQQSRGCRGDLLLLCAWEFQTDLAIGVENFEFKSQRRAEIIDRWHNRRQMQRKGRKTLDWGTWTPQKSWIGQEANTSK